METKPLISIIIPVYNSACFIKKTLDSIFDQSFTDYEIIAVNDGSTDASLDILHAYKEKQSRLQVVSISNRGVSNARNVGLSYAAGEYVLFIDSDDLLENNALKTIVQHIASTDLLIFGYKKIFSSGMVMQRCLSHYEMESSEQIRDYINCLDFNDKDLFMNYLWNRLFKKSIIDENRIQFDVGLTLGEDFVFICEYLKYAKSIKIVEDKCYLYFIRENLSLSQKFYPDEFARRQRMQNVFKDLLAFYGCNRDAYDMFSVIEGQAVFACIRKIFASNCTLSFRQKFGYVKQFYYSPCKNYMDSYLVSQKTKKNRIYRIVLRIGIVPFFVLFYLFR